jgi:hypothetical protein
MIPPEWAVIFAALGEKGSVVLGIFFGGRLLLISLATGVATFHRDEKRRADARKVLKRLLPYGRRHRAPKTLPPPEGDERPPAQVASVQEIGRARRELHG